MAAWALRQRCTERPALRSPAAHREARQVQQALDVQVVCRQDQLEQRALVNLQGQGSGSGGGGHGAASKPLPISAHTEPAPPPVVWPPPLPPAFVNSVSQVLISSSLLAALPASSFCSALTW